MGDLSNVDGTKINTDETTAAATAHYGQIRYPTIDDIAVLIYDFWRAGKERDPSARWENMRIWTMDLRGACTLLFFRPEDVGLFAMLLSDDLVYLQMIGYTISLPENRLLISRKKFLTALHGCISTDVTKRINLRAAQRLASFGTRYGKICRVMRPFCRALYPVTWGRVDEHAIFPLSTTEAIIAIQC
jgi:hypothetical protein